MKAKLFPCLCPHIQQITQVWSHTNTGSVKTCTLANTQEELLVFNVTTELQVKWTYQSGWHHYICDGNKCTCRANLHVALYCSWCGAYCKCHLCDGDARFGLVFCISVSISKRMVKLTLQFAYCLLTCHNSRNQSVAPF